MNSSARLVLVFVAFTGGALAGCKDEEGARSSTDGAASDDGAVDGDRDGGPIAPGVDLSGPDGGDPLKSIDTGTDPQFPVGDIKLVISGAQITVNAGRKVQTAAGVYTADGTLVRTLWRRRVVEANASTDITWDGKDDLGADVPDGAYKVHVLAHNVSYKWQGVVGNTSNPGASGLVSTPFNVGGGTQNIDTVGPNIHRSFHPLSSIAIGANGSAFVATGYNEMQNGMGRFEITDPQKKTLLVKDDFQRSFELVATDGNRAYFVNTGVHGNDIFNHPENFIIGVEASNNTEVSFAAGSAWTDGLGDGNHWASVIDQVPDGQDQIRGIAVEASGNKLYVAHKDTGIKIIDKGTGACANTSSPYAGNCGSSFAVPDPYDLALAPNGDLWVIANNRTEVRRYTDPGGAHTLSTTITGFGKATGLGISPLTSTLIVVDAGPDQQLKAFKTDGTPQWTHGDKGGYTTTSGPDVTTNKLNFTNEASSHNFVAFEPGADEVFWVGDPGNFRNLKYKLPASPAATNPLEYKDQILYVPVSYNATVDKGNPTRVFSSFLEFFVDYSKPFTQSWRLARNWDIAVPGKFKTGLISGPRDVFTTPQGKTFAVLPFDDNGPKNQIMELTSTGLRDTGITLQYGERFHENMNLRMQKENGDQLQIVQRDFTGIDGNGNPSFATEKVVATVPKKNASGQYNPYIGFCANGAQEPQYPKTSSGVIITFDPCAFSSGDYSPDGNHLGGVKVDGTDYAFRSSPGGAFTLDAAGLIVDGDGAFNLQNLQQNYAGSAAATSGRSVLYNYFGEFWNNGQATQWMHWLDNGLFIGQFGVPSFPALNRNTPLVGSAGNTFTTSMVTVDGNLYIYHNDESVHAGVHRWRAQNMSSMQEMIGNIGKNTAVTNPAEIVSTALTP